MKLLVCDTYEFELGGIQPFLRFLHDKALERGDFDTDTWVVVVNLPSDWTEDDEPEDNVSLELAEDATPEETMEAMEKYFEGVNAISSEVQETAFQVKEFLDCAVLPFQLRKLEYFAEEGYMHLVLTPTDLLDV